MSIKLMSEAWGTSGLTASQKLVLLAFCDYSNDDGKCWPTMKQIAEKCDMTERNLRNHVITLEKKGMLKVSSTFGNLGYQGHNLFNVLAPEENFTPPCRKLHPTKPSIKEKENNIKEKENNIKEKEQIPPDLKDVVAYCQERHNGVDPDKWFNFYQAKGWMIGKSRMKDWKAAVRTWEPKVTNQHEEAYIR